MQGERDLKHRNKGDENLSEIMLNRDLEETGGEYKVDSDIYRKIDIAEQSIAKGDVMDGFESLRKIREIHGL